MIILTKNKQASTSSEQDKPTINSDQKGNPIFKILIPPEKYFKLVETQIPDFIIPKQRLMILFVFLSYLEQYPKYLEEKILRLIQQNLLKEYQNKMVLLLLDKEDVMDYLSDIQLMLVPYRIKLILLWSYEEVAQFLKKLIERN